MKTFVVEVFRGGDVNNVIRQLISSGAVWIKDEVVPFHNVDGIQIGLQTAIIYQAEKEISVEVQT